MRVSATRSALVAPLLLLTIDCAAAPPGSRNAPRPQRNMVTAADLETTNEPIERVIQRKIPGLEVERAGDGSLSLRIRGNKTTTANDAPLYVVDEVMIEAPPGQALTGINPHEIDTIKVLKGPEAGMYGIRGLNGVIVVTTKRGRKP